MLNKMEAAYLGILRVVVLIAATLALAAAALIAVTTIPTVLTRMGVIAPDDQPLTLSEFVDEHRLATDGQSETSEEMQVSDRVDPAVKDAAANFHKYLGSRATQPLRQWELGLTELASTVPVPNHADYTSSLTTLSQELLRSTGKPLSERRVGELVQWHHDRFIANIEQRTAAQAAADVAFYTQLAAAAAAFFIFIFIVFIFIFIRIERNLRRPPSEEAGDYA